LSQDPCRIPHDPGNLAVYGFYGLKSRHYILSRGQHLIATPITHDHFTTIIMSTLSIRLPNSIHQHAKRLAQDEGISVNQLVSSALAEKLSAIDAERYLNERAERGKAVNIDAILAKVPEIEPEAHDRISP
jgi:hypothetical protein